VVDVKALIKKQREKIETPVTGVLKVVLGGEKVELEFAKLAPDTWDELVSKNPPRPGVEGDAIVGYSAPAVSREYPGVKLDGEELDAETWAETFSVLDSLHRNNVSLSIWGLNIHASIKELQDLGKV
jgi:hypothetical protein